MRIMLFLIGIFLVWGCKTTKTEPPIWYSPKLGFVQIKEDFIQFYPVNCITSQKWTRRNGTNQYYVENLGIDACHLSTNTDEKSVVIIQNKRNRLVISSKDSCFAAIFHRSEFQLEKIEKIFEDINYDVIAIESQIDGKTIFDRLSKKELDDLNTESLDKKKLFPINYQIWILFESGLDHHSESDQDVINFVFKMYHKGKLINSKTVNTTPCYLRYFQNYVFEKLQSK